MEQLDLFGEIIKNGPKAKTWICPNCHSVLPVNKNCKCFTELNQEFDLAPPFSQQDKPSQETLPSPQVERQGDSFEVCLPLYWHIPEKIYKRNDPKGKFKKGDIKKAQNILLGMNWYRNAHFIVQNEGKAYVANFAKKQFPFRDTRWETFSVDYELWYKNVVSDPLNIIACIDKFMVDALVDSRIVVKDTVKNYLSGEWKIGGQDRSNPRLEATVRKI